MAKGWTTGYFLLGFVTVFVVLGEVVKGDAEISNGEVENKDLILTYRQKVILDQLKKRVLHRLPHNYMKEDIFLSRWLRAKHFDIGNTEEALMENIRWRRENRMDEIQKEDYSDIKEGCPIYTDTVAKNGQPVVSAQVCDMRKEFLTGRDRRMIRYIIQSFDKATILVREAQQAGKNVTRFDLIENLDSFNLIQNGCPRCMFAFAENLQVYQKYYPEVIDKVILINTPSYIYNIFAPIVQNAISMSGTTNSINFKIFGTDRKQWKQYLLQYIDESQLAEELGGHRVRQ